MNLNGTNECAMNPKSGKKRQVCTAVVQARVAPFDTEADGDEALRLIEEAASNRCGSDRLP
jgi:hypothetical protein